MKDVAEILSGLASQGYEGILSPTTEERLGKRGIHIPKPPKLTLEQSIELIFSETSKQKALAIAKHCLNRRTFPLRLFSRFITRSEKPSFSG